MIILLIKHLRTIASDSCQQLPTTTTAAEFGNDVDCPTGIPPSIPALYAHQARVAVRSHHLEPDYALEEASIEQVDVTVDRVPEGGHIVDISARGYQSGHVVDISARGYQVGHVVDISARGYQREDT